MTGLFLLLSFVGHCSPLSVVVPTAPVAVIPGDMALLPATLVLPAPQPPFFQVRWRFLPTGRLVLLLAAQGCSGAASWRESCHLGVERGWGYEGRVDLGPHDASLLLQDARAEDAGTYRVSLLGLDIQASAELNLTLNPDPITEPTSLLHPITPAPASTSEQQAHTTLLMAVSRTSSLESLHSNTTVNHHQSLQRSEVLSEGMEPPLALVTAAGGGGGAVMSNAVRLGLAGLVLCFLALIAGEVPLPGSLLQCQAKEDEEGYTVLNLRPKEGASAGPTPARIQGPCPNPCWHRQAWWAACVVIAVLVVTILVLGIWVSQLVSEKVQSPEAPSSDGAGSRNTSTAPGTEDTCTANCNTRLELFQSRLTQSLCPPARLSPAGRFGCKLCPMDWHLHEAKCYWVSRENKLWNESRTDCSARGSRLLVIQDREELESLKNLTQDTSQFWVGLSHSLEKGWAWVDGSQVDQTLFLDPEKAEENSCGSVKGNQIRSETCSSAFKWICQRATVLL